MTNDHAAQFKRLCTALIITYTRSTQRLVQVDRLVPYNDGGDVATEWSGRQAAVN